MIDTPTPGQLAYEAYTTAVAHAFVAPGITERLWAHLGPAEQQCWEAAAQAVLARHNTPQEDDG
jgi:hypothetical protein